MQDLDPIALLEARVAEIERTQAQMQLRAKVEYVYRKSSDPGIKSEDDGSWLGHVDVRIEAEPEPIIIKRRPFATFRHGEDLTFWLPSKDENGILFSPSGELGQLYFCACTDL